MSVFDYKVKEEELTAEVSKPRIYLSGSIDEYRVLTGLGLTVDRAKNLRDVLTDAIDRYYEVYR